MMKKKDRKEIFDLFCQTFSEKEFEVVSGLNPCIIKYNGTRYNGKPPVSRVIDF